MHAWLLLLAVLATSSPLVQVASTENPLQPLSPLSSRTSVSLSFDTNSGSTNPIPGESVDSLIEPTKQKVNKSSVVLSASNQLTVYKRYPRRVKMSSEEVRERFSDESGRASDRSGNALVVRRSVLKSSLIENSVNSEVQSYRKWKVEKRRRRLLRRRQHSKPMSPSGEEIVKSRTVKHAKHASDSLDLSVTEQRALERTSTPTNWARDNQSNQPNAKDALAAAPSSVIEFRYLKDKKGAKSRKAVDDLRSKQLESETGEMKTELSTNVQNQVKKSLLSLLKMDRPPVIDRSKIVIPEIMTQLYARKKNLDWNYVARSFTHKRK